jgi:1-acyl-sn-glycerol-3-phosphate acyltransferase
MKTIISILVWIGAALVCIFMYFVMQITCIILFPFDKDRRIAHIQANWWAGGITALIPRFTILVKGRENIDKNGTYVIVANHKSMLDIFVMYKIRHQFKWVAKESLFKIPFLGWMMSICKYIKLSRGSFSSIKKAYKETSFWLRRGISVIFFPEGTRSETDQMRDFHNGAFKIAIKEKVKVLPVRIEGTEKVVPKGSRIIKSNVVCTLTILPPIDASNFNAADFEKLRDLTRDAIESGVTNS